MSRNKPKRQGEEDRLNREEDITLGGGYGIDGLEPDIKKEVDVCGEEAPELILSTGADAQFSLEKLDWELEQKQV